MPRVPLLTPSDADPVTRAMLVAARRRLGVVPDSWAAAAHHRQLLMGQAAFELALERSHAVEQRLTDLISLRAAAVVGCEFCIDIGTHLAREQGVPDEQLAALPGYRESPLFDARDRAALDLATAMTRTPQEVDDELWSRLREHFDDRQIVELCSTIAWENYRARMNHALGLGSQGFVTDAPREAAVAS